MAQHDDLTCGCGCEHEHREHKHEHDCGCDHEHGPACGCGHEHEHGPECGCGHEHDEHDEPHTHSMSIYEFLGYVLVAPPDETLLYNVCDPEFWEGLRGKIENERTAAACAKLIRAAHVLRGLPDDLRESALDAEFAEAFTGSHAWMPPVESAYEMVHGEVREIARSFGIEDRLLPEIPADHIANELFLLAPIDNGMPLDPGQLKALARYFEQHPMTLLRNMLEHVPADCDGTGFYRAIVEFTLAWLQWDLDAFNG